MVMERNTVKIVQRIIQMRAYPKIYIDLQFLLLQFTWMIFTDLFPNPVHD